VVWDGQPGWLGQALAAPPFHLLLCGPVGAWDPDRLGGLVIAAGFGYVSTAWVIAAGFGYASTAWVGVGLAGAGLAVATFSTLLERR
jgi:hypothetical protein